MVDAFNFLKQQVQADLIRSNTHSLRMLGTSEWSLTSAKPSDTADYVEERMNNPGSHWSQYSEPTTIGGENVSDFIGPKPASDRKLKTSPSSRRHWMSRVQQMDSQVTSTHQILDRLRNDYAELARNVSRIEQKTQEAAASVHTMMGHSLRSSSRERTISATNSHSPQTDFRTGHWIDPSVESRLQNTRMTLETLRNDPIRYSNSGLSEIGQPYRSLTSYHGYSGTPGVDFVRSSWTGNV
ncbi:hypothetical protein FGIG_07815 [Fasciola gigantica]|uniref:Uncharacterized protein n=1 Tax=Fasciola gigantica TaxID=46835 RepID=A0A504YJE0_FASGI|nr:hypothetical protein FGIG_07815 [Fasciola gigantica]